MPYAILAMHDDAEDNVTLGPTARQSHAASIQCHVELHDA